jgi:hypothetical protein
MAGRFSPIVADETLIDGDSVEFGPFGLGGGRRRSGDVLLQPFHNAFLSGDHRFTFGTPRACVLSESAATIASQQPGIDIRGGWVGNLAIEFLEQSPPIENGQLSATAAIGEDGFTEGVVEDVVDEDGPAILTLALRVHNLRPDC